MNQKDRGEIIRRQILKDVLDHPTDLVRHISALFDITSQAVTAHIRKLEESEQITSSGKGKGKRYYLGDKRSLTKVFHRSDKLDEGLIWTKHFSFIVDGLPKNIVDICHYGFTEIFNNAIDHSEGELICAAMRRDEKNVCIYISDNGEGIFKKIKRVFKLSDEHQAILELSKGKLTTDPKNHSGEGIFFTSRVFDFFKIESKKLSFTHSVDSEYDFIYEDPSMPEDSISTFISMIISRKSKRTDKEVFDAYTSGPEDFNFSKTTIPVKLAQYGDEKLVSRSQAKRMLIRVERFQNVVLDFAGVASVGQAFADEVFRVYQNSHPNIVLVPVNMTDEVKQMVERAKALLRSSESE